jgi:hypothetical protein
MSLNNNSSILSSRSSTPKSELVKQWLLIALLAAAAYLVLTLESPLPPRLGTFDFRAYWSASYLLAHSQNFADEALLFQVQKEQTGLQHDWAVMTWNPPWLLVLLLPYTVVPFAQASWWWFLTNIVMVFSAAVMVWHAAWQSHRPESIPRHYIWLMVVAAFVFSPTLVAFIAGQVNILVLIGLAAFLYGRAKGWPLLAGMALALTMVKPHLVYVTLPLLFLELTARREWRPLLGLTMAIAGLSLVAFLLRPEFLLDYGRSVGSGGLFRWQTPTLGGLLAAWFGWQWAKLMGLVVLPLAVLAWWHWRTRVAVATLIDVTLFISIITAPFGWSYDFVVLLIPVWHALTRATADSRRPILLIMLFFLALVTALSFYQRAQSWNELYFAWLPPALAMPTLAGLYLWNYERTENS